MTTQSTPITYKSQTLTLKQWAELLNLHYPTLRARYDRGLQPPHLFAKSHKTIATTPITYNGLTMQLRHWAKELRISYPTLRMRYTRGMQPPELFHAKPKNAYNPKPHTPHAIFITHQNETRSLYAWSRVLNTGFVTAYNKYLQGERDFDKLFNADT
jgi:hypothetical protein